MIPRFRPYLFWDEYRQIFQWKRNAVQCFEERFASQFGAKHAFSFSYGRAALWEVLKALGIENAEIILPAYTCVVVAHAIVLSGNIPRFVDIQLNDFNMDLNQVEGAINFRTRVVIATHLFGYPLDVQRLAEIVRNAESRFGHKIWIIQDCAHSFAADWNGSPVCQAGDLALFGLNISKTITSVFGGMITTDQDEVANALTHRLPTRHALGHLVKDLRRRLYFFAAGLAFVEPVYSGVYWLQNHTSLLDIFTKAYHLDDIIRFPPDYQEPLTNFEATVGLIQLEKYPEIIQLRKANSAFYEDLLRKLGCIRRPPLEPGATFSHYPILVNQREKITHFFEQRGIQLGNLIDYSVPDIPIYSSYSQGQTFPNSSYCSQHMINLPIYPGLSRIQLEKIASTLQEYYDGVGEL